MKKIRLFTICIALFYMPMEAQIIDSLFPEFRNWEKAGLQKMNSSRELYEYIDGGAELYLSYGFKEAASITYTLVGQPEIIAEVFDMQGDSNAYGVFSNMREKEEYTWGDGSQHITGSIIFWKSHYFVSLMTPRETQENKEAMKYIASGIDQAITGKGVKPAILNYLPVSGLNPANVLYFRHYIWANSFYYLADSDILGIGTQGDAVWARYGDSQNRQYILLVRYPPITFAADMAKDFLHAFSPGSEVNTPTQIEDNHWFALIPVQHFLIGLFNFSSEDQLKKRMEYFNQQNYE